MPEPKPGDIFLAQITGWTGFLVRIGQWCNGDGSVWTHAGIYRGNGEVFEAQPGGAVISPLSRYDGRPLKWSTDVIELTDEQREWIVQETNWLVGIGYGWLTYAYLAAYRLGIRPEWLKNRVRNTRDMICSQSVDEVFNRAGVHLFQDGRLPQDVTPGDIDWMLDGLAHDR